MILSKSYHEIMEKIEVTDEIRTRILNNVSKQVFSIHIRRLHSHICGKWHLLLPALHSCSSVEP